MNCRWFWILVIMAVVVLVEIESAELSSTDSSVYLALQQLLGVSAGRRRAVEESTAPSLPGYMMELYEKYRSDDLVGRKLGNTVRSIHASKDSHSRLSGDIIYNLTGIHPDEHVIRAEIHYYLRPRRRHFNVRGPPAFRAKLFAVDKNHDIDLDTIDLPLTSRGWHVMDVTTAVTNLRTGNHVPPLLGTRFEKSFPSGIRYFKLGKWKTLPFLIVFSQDKNSFQDGLVNSTKPKPVTRLRLPRSTLTNRVSEDHFIEDNNFPEVKTSKPNRESNPGILHPRKPKNRRQKRPFFDAFRDTTSAPKRHRADKPRNEADIRNICHRKKLTVNFAQIGWGHWIISPKTFEAHYCAGACVPLTKNVRPSNHATIQSLIHALGARENVPPPCCVPETMSSLTLLYLDEDRNVILKNYPQMSVETCACR